MPPEPSEQQLAQVKRFGAVLGREIPDPAATFHLWKKIAEQVRDYHRNLAQDCILQETVGTDDKGVVRGRSSRSTPTCAGS